MKQAGAGNATVPHCCGDCCRGGEVVGTTEKYKENT